jgi:uncharacterized protein (DUF1330 family)
MANGYWVVHLDVTDLGAYQTYREFVQPFLDRNGGRFLIRGGAQSVAEGSVKPRTVVVEFASYADATRLYYSAEYQEGLKLRTAVSSADFAIVEGYDS